MKQRLRTSLRDKRSRHPDWYRIRSAKAAALSLHTSDLLKRHRRVASYIDIEHEFPTQTINHTILYSGAEICFPVITDYQNASMKFSHWKSTNKFRNNRYGIPEPINILPGIELIQPELILLPLLGFDENGNRIGMGGGYYDRYLAGLKASKMPHLIGLAFNNQHVNSIKNEPHDIPIEGVITESGLQYFKR